MSNEKPPSTRDEAVSELVRHLTATAKRPVRPATNRWLGEAEAVARDAATDELDADVRITRVQQVAELLGSAGETGDDVADDHLESARACCAAVLDE